MADVTVLCAADLHLGRRASLSGGWDGGRLSATDAWQRLVDRAIADAVDVVLLAGDVIDQHNRSFEAWGPLERGVGALGEAGIPVVAVAGNHDHDTLHEVATEIGASNLTVLGRGGRWERWTLRDGDGRPRLHVDGWSFPDRRWEDDPTSSYDPGARSSPGGAPVVGLLHADLDQVRSVYGPVSTTRLRSLSAAAWILGHIHVPSLREEPGVAPVLYPGSLQALDAGETGPRGAWRLEIRDGRATGFRHIPLSSVRYDTLDVDAEGVDDEAALNALVRQTLRDHLAACAAASTGPLRLLHCRVRLTGRTPLHGRIPDLLAGLDDFAPTDDTGLRLTVDGRPTIDTRPALDLEALARGADAPALLARLLLDPEPTTVDPRTGTGGGDEDVASLLDRASREAAEVASRSQYATTGLQPLDLDPSSPRVAAGVRRQAARLLDALMTRASA